MRQKRLGDMNWNIRLANNLVILSAAVFLCVRFADSRPATKIDSLIQARIDSIPSDSNMIFSEIPEWKPFMDSAYAAFIKKKGADFQWMNLRYPLKLNRSFFDKKLKKNKEASENKGPRLPKSVEGEAFAVSEDRAIDIVLFKGEKIVLVCDTIVFDGLVGRTVWKGHVKNSVGSDVSMFFDRSNIFISIYMLERASFKISSPFDNGLYILEQIGPSLYPVDYIGRP